MNLDDLANDLHYVALGKGFWDNYRDSPNEFIGMKLALIHSEVTEVLEAIRKGKTEEEVMAEFADILIRTLDLIAGLNENYFMQEHSIDEAIALKANINRDRPTLHGNKF